MVEQKFYFISLSGDMLRGKFGEQADNDVIVAELDATLHAMVEAKEITHTPNAIKVDGPASLQVVSVITHRIGHLVGALAFRDPKLFVEDPINGHDFVVAPGTQYERTVKCVGKFVKKGDKEVFVPDNVYVVTVTHSQYYKVGDKLSS